MKESNILVSNNGHREMVNGAIQAFNDHDLDRWMSFYAEDVIHIQPDKSEPQRGRAVIREDYQVSTWLPFPDFHFDLELAFGQDDWLCVHGTFRGTQDGPLQGPDDTVIEPTHRSVSIPLCMVIRVEDGLMTEVHEYNDQLTFLTQLGLMVE